MIKVAIVVLNYNGLKNTLECLASIKKISQEKFSIDTIVVDNNSVDGSKKTLAKIKNIQFIQNTQNTGFSGGNNEGIKLALKRGANFILILNNDTIVDENLLKNLLDIKDKAEIISPKIYFAPTYEFHKERYAQSDLGRVIWYAGGKIDWENILGVHFGVNEVDKGQFNKLNEIDFATGACIFIKKDVFEKVGFFDEKYFLYLEDMDLSVRAKRAGFKIFFQPSAIIWHKNAQSLGGTGSKIQDYYITRNRLLFAFKFAKLRTKIALLKQIISQSRNPVKRKALLDFLFNRFGKTAFI